MDKFNFGGKEWKPVTKAEINPPEVKFSDNEEVREIKSKRNREHWQEKLNYIYDLPRELSLILLEKLDQEEKKSSLLEEIKDEQGGENDKEQLEQLGKELEDMDMKIEFLDRKLERLVSSNTELKEAHDEYLKKLEALNESHNPTDPTWN